MLKLTSEKLRVFKNESTGRDGSIRTYYTYSISSKQEDGTYAYMSKIIKFRKGEAPESTCDIKVLDSFQSFFVKDDEKIDYLMVKDYEIVTEKEEDPFEDFGSQIVLTDDDLPF